jgi:aryl-alcohol dehydrogenase-like predicted oxidoreductase
LRAIGQRHNSSPGAVAVAWTLHNPAVTAAIVGARKPEQVNDMVAAAETRLTESEIKEVENVPQLAA